jgi:alpha-tubulin suppressor-like RCC1 family protein
MATYRTFSAGDSWSMAIQQDGKLVAWGRNDQGQLGIGSTANQLAPVHVPLPEVREIAAGMYSSLARDSDGRLHAWGSHWARTLGRPATEPQLLPLPVQRLQLNRFFPGPPWARFICGWQHCLVESRGLAFAWGAPPIGALGDGTGNMRIYPTRVVDLRNVVALAAGHMASYALRRDGAVFAWGQGIIGDGQSNGPLRLSPVPVGGLPAVAAITAGNSHALALLPNGKVWAWGNNGVGQLGDGTQEDRLTPVAVPGLTNVVAIAAGGSYSIALRSNGTVYGWGNNLYGVLGPGLTGGTSLEPRRIEGLTKIKAISTSSSALHVLAVDLWNRLWSWGANEYGQLGDGQTAYRRFEPMQVEGIGAVAL